MKHIRLPLAIGVLALVLCAGWTAGVSTDMDADKAMQTLVDGNERFVSGEREYPHLDAARIAETAEGQAPFVTIVSCADSRVPPEHVFDSGIGDLFVIRVAGNVCDRDTLGTLEYGVGVLGTPLLVVMGHSSCGAVDAVVKDAPVGGNIPALVDNIVPAVMRVRARHPNLEGKELLAAAVTENVWRGLEDIFHNSPTVIGLMQEEKVKVVGAIYDLATGKVEFLGEHPDQDEWLED